MCFPTSVTEASCHPASIPVTLVCFQLEHMLSFFSCRALHILLNLSLSLKFLYCFPFHPIPSHWAIPELDVLKNVATYLKYLNYYICNTFGDLFLPIFFFKNHWFSCFVLHSFSTNPVPQFAWLLCLLLNFFLYQQFQVLSPLGYQKVSFMSQHLSLPLN